MIVQFTMGLLLEEQERIRGKRHDIAKAKPLFSNAKRPFIIPVNVFIRFFIF